MDICRDPQRIQLLFQPVFARNQTEQIFMFDINLLAEPVPDPGHRRICRSHNLPGVRVIPAEYCLQQAGQRICCRLDPGFFPST